MTELRQAFERAGLPAASVAFAAACHDLARLALNREPNPARAAHVFLGMAAGHEFRARLVEFIGSVAAERQAAKSDGEGQGYGGAEGALFRVAPPSDPSMKSGGDAAQADSGAASAHRTAGPLAPDPKSDGEGHHRGGAEGALKRPAPPSDPKPEGTEDQALAAHLGHVAVIPIPSGPVNRLRIAAVAGARERSARATSGFYITERQGGRTAIEDIEVSRTDALLRHLEKRAGDTTVELFAIRLIKAKLPAFAPSGSSYGDVFSDEELRETVALARRISGSAMTLALKSRDPAPAEIAL